MSKPVTFVVNSTDDDDDGTANNDSAHTRQDNSAGDPEVTFRSAITATNEMDGLQLIQFDIPESYATEHDGTSYFIIMPKSALPTILDSVWILGDTQSEDDVPVIVIRGDDAGAGVDER